MFDGEFARLDGLVFSLREIFPPWPLPDWIPMSAFPTPGVFILRTRSELLKNANEGF